MRFSTNLRNKFAGGNFVTKHIFLLFQTSWITKLDVEDAIADRVASPVEQFEELADVLARVNPMSTNILIAESHALVAADSTQLLDLSSQFKAILAISTERQVSLPKIIGNLIVLDAPFQEGDLAAALTKCGL